MKFFLDTANLDELKKGAAWGVVDGVTTNPSLIAKEGRPMAEQIRMICDIVDGDISAEVVAIETKEMLREGHELARIHKNVVVKCPLTRDGIRATKALSQEGIRVNVTLCFSAGQALLAAKAGAYITSPFVGRLDDIGRTGAVGGRRSRRGARRVGCLPVAEEPSDARRTRAPAARPSPFQRENGRRQPAGVSRPPGLLLVRHRRRRVLGLPGSCGSTDGAASGPVGHYRPRNHEIRSTQSGQLHCVVRTVERVAHAHRV